MRYLLLILLLLVGCNNTPVEIDNDDHTHDIDNHTHYYCRYIIDAEDSEYYVIEYGCFNVNTYSECAELDNIYGLSEFEEFYVESGTCEYFCDVVTFDNNYENCECIDDECIDLLQD